MATCSNILTETGTELLTRLSKPNLLATIDEVLFPHFDDRSVVELYGGSGVGKSQLLLHIIIRSITPKKWKSYDIGGIEVGVLFIDNDHHFSMFRLVKLLENKLKCCLGIRSTTPEEMHEFVSSCLTRLLFARCSDSLQLSATLQKVYRTSEYSQRGCKVIMIDSLSAFYWEDSMTKIRTSFELRDFYSHLASVLRSLVNNHGFTLFFTRLAFKKTANDKEYYYLGRDIQNLADWKLSVSCDYKTSSRTITVCHLLDKEEINFQILENGFHLANVNSHAN